MAINKYLSKITLNINGLNAPKKQRVAEWVRIHDPYICCLHEIQLRTKDLCKLKVKGWGKKFHGNRDEKKKSWGNNNYIGKNRLQNKDHKKRQTRSLNNTRRNNPTRGP